MNNSHPFRISEESEGVVKSGLDDKINSFESKLVQGALFYLPEGPVLGGDSFMLGVDDELTFALLSDLPEKRQEAREKLNEYRPYFEDAFNVLASNELNPTGLSRSLFTLDRKAAEKLSLFALTLVRITGSGKMYYINAGTNILLKYNQSENNFDISLESRANKDRWGIMGVFSLATKFKKERKSRKILYSQFSEVFTLEESGFHSGDKVIICSDGVFDIGPGTTRGNPEIMFQNIQTQIRKPPLELVRTINEKNAEYLKQGTLRPDQKYTDDYTIIVIERK